MFIASKFEDIYAPEGKDFVYMTDDAYVLKQLLEMEIDVMKELFRYAENWDHLDAQRNKSYIELAHIVGADVCADSIMSVLLSTESWNKKKSIIDEIKTTELFMLCANVYSKKISKRSIVMFCVKNNHIGLLRFLSYVKKRINGD